MPEVERSVKKLLLREPDLTQELRYALENNLQGRNDGVDFKV